MQGEEGVEVCCNGNESISQLLFDNYQNYLKRTYPVGSRIKGIRNLDVLLLVGDSGEALSLLLSMKGRRYRRRSDSKIANKKQVESANG